MWKKLFQWLLVNVAPVAVEQAADALKRKQGK